MKKREELAKEIMTEYEEDGEPITFEEALEIADAVSSLVRAAG